MAHENEIGFKFKVFLGELETGFSKAQAKVNKFTSSTQKSFDKIGKSAKNIFEGKFSMFGGLIAGAAIYETIKKVGEFDDKIRRLAIDANMSSAEMLKFKQQVLDTGISTGVSTDDLTDMGNEAYKSSKNIAFVTQELAFMAKVAQASGASGTEVGAMLGDLQRDTGLTGAAFEDMVKKLGAFGATKGARMNLKSFLPNAKDLLSTAKILAKTGAIKDIGVVLREGMFTGSPRAVAQAYLTMHGKGNLELIKKLGLKQGFTLTDAIQSVFEKIPKAKQMAAFEMLLGRRSIKGLEPMIDDIKELAQAEREAAGIDFLGRSTGQAMSFFATMNRLGGVFLKLADSSIAPIIKDLADEISKIDPKDLEGLAKAFEALGFGVLHVAQGAGLLINALTDLPALIANFQGTAAGGNAGTSTRVSTIGDFIKKGSEARRAGKTDVARRYYQAALKDVDEEKQPGLRSQIQTLLTNLELKTNTNVVVQIDGKDIPSKSTSKTTTGRGPQATPK